MEVTTAAVSMVCINKSRRDNGAVEIQRNRGVGTEVIFN